jgi:hypothetical protein
MECPLAYTFLFFEMPGGILHFVTPNTLRKISEVFLGKEKKQSLMWALYWRRVKKKKKNRK